jgi:hypothetical protein
VNARDKQVGGDHYKTLKIQPLEVTYLQFGYTGLLASVHTKVNKYLTRKKNDHIENIDKAIHCLQILRDIAIEERHAGTDSRRVHRGDGDRSRSVGTWARISRMLGRK